MNAKSLKVSIKGPHEFPKLYDSLVWLCEKNGMLFPEFLINGPTSMLSTKGTSLDPVGTNVLESLEFQTVMAAVYAGKTGLTGVFRSGRPSSAISSVCVSFSFGFYRIGYSVEHDLYWIMNVATKTREFIYTLDHLIERTECRDVSCDVVPPPCKLNGYDIRDLTIV